MGVMKRIATARALGDRSRSIKDDPAWCYKKAEGKQTQETHDMPHDKIASDIINWLDADLKHGERIDRWYGENLDYHVLSTRCDVPGQLDVWLEDGMTGKKVLYHVTVEKAAIQPKGQTDVDASSDEKDAG